MERPVETMFVYLAVGLLAASIGLVWWQTGTMLAAVLVAEAWLNRRRP